MPPASGLEGRTKEILAEAGLGGSRRQVDVGDDRWVGRVDFLSERAPLIVEVQSERYHRSLSDEWHDAARRAALEAAGSSSSRSGTPTSEGAFLVQVQVSWARTWSIDWVRRRTSDGSIAGKSAIRSWLRPSLR